MLVLTRKSKEQIRIGDDITITVVRLQGNSVRIGIDAPREMRVVRGELAPLERVSSGLEPSELEPDTQVEACDRSEVFAHPQPKQTRRTRISRVQEIVEPSPSRPQLYVGSVERDGGSAKVRRAPLSGFMSAT